MKDIIIKSAGQRIIYTQHALDEMNAEDELVTADEVRYVVLNGEIIEDYPEDKRGHSFLLHAVPDKRAIHVVCAPKDSYLAIITVYLPTLDKWEEDLKTRRKK